MNECKDEINDKIGDGRRVMTRRRTDGRTELYGVARVLIDGREHGGQEAKDSNALNVRSRGCRERSGHQMNADRA